MKSVRDVIVIFFITLLLFEVALRIWGRYDTLSEKTTGQYVSFYHPCGNSWYLIRPGGDSITDSKSEFTFRYPRNSAGFCTREIPSVKNPQRKRMFVLGDSFTQGIGAPADSSWPVLFETLLNSKSDSAYEVFNAGLGGSDPFFAYRLLADRIMTYNPDEVIFSINGTDILDYVGHGGMERFKPDGTTCFKKAPWFEPLYAHSRLARCVLAEIFHYDYTLMSQKDFQELQQRALYDIAEVAKQAKKLCDERNVKFQVLIYPGVADYSHRLPKPETFFVFNLVPILRDNHINVLDARPCFANVVTVENCKDYAWPIDGHFKSKGYALMAQCVYDFFIQDRLVIMGKMPN